MSIVILGELAEGNGIVSEPSEIKASTAHPSVRIPLEASGI